MSQNVPQLGVDLLLDELGLSLRDRQIVPLPLVVVEDAQQNHREHCEYYAQECCPCLRERLISGA